MEELDRYHLKKKMNVSETGWVKVKGKVKEGE
jgi:hypothetical protein